MCGVDDVKFDAQGLVPAIAQDAENGQILMMAWMNKASLERTLAEGRAVYWSRSRQEFWRKGDSSGHVQEVLSLALDCDGDSIVMQVRQTGAACHTGERSCFFRKLTV
ncbi:MAG TPA: phosphoribosyl-AMP cyclohydrolase [Alphaproteobacteria bacterium]|nr:phosphoribosyl-AMP cyclohydrolase [Paracoccaceae bacterium]RCL81250.1 MAG: phosphoribosyl-AMP cyclohydrolase [SAR116 cluster bacterium]RPH14602.1 MAG: phosphoribosyl-AMP cyclohydrolase [Alphaproteobacteria bacterium TMED150]HBQ22186.1 phosphoribosyl-AMP cyclohydrolase [Alphaproteobacteria bacterium]HCJ61539.1 phosphoribosyl-AMP cyclohydrolase [Alphaproteobacteria bacterium]